MVEKHGTSVGEVAPGFRLLASTGGEIALADYVGRSQVALFFVRGIRLNAMPYARRPVGTGRS